MLISILIIAVLLMAYVLTEMLSYKTLVKISKWL